MPADILQLFRSANEDPTALATHARRVEGVYQRVAVNMRAEAATLPEGDPDRVALEWTATRLSRRWN